MIIIGSGITGIIASRFFHSEEVYEASDSIPNSHHAVMRIRDPRVGMLLGVEMKSVDVKKGVFFKGSLLDKSNITINNLYSLKVSGTLSNKSILNLDDAKRYLLPSKFKLPAINYSHKLIKLERGSMTFELSNKLHKTIEFENCISTIPLFSILNITGLIPTDRIVLKYKQIYVTILNLSVSSSVNQTIYFPEESFNTYRATLEGERLIIESVAPCHTDEIDKVLGVFGISNIFVGNKETFTQKLGKLIEIDEEDRKSIISELTDRFGIYSLGRFAIWKQIRTDDVINDLETIKKLLSMGQKRRAYENKLIGIHK